MVDAERVVAHADEVGDEAVSRLARRGEVRLVAEVDAVEALRDARNPLELKVVADGDDPSELACRSMARQCLREVKRRTRLDPRVETERNPVRPGLDGYGFGNDIDAKAAENSAKGCGKFHRMMTVVALGFVSTVAPGCFTRLAHANSTALASSVAPDATVTMP